MAAQPVIQYILSRLKDLTVTDDFCVPGDFDYPVNRDKGVRRWPGGQSSHRHFRGIASTRRRI